MTKLSYDYAATFEGRTTQNRIAKLPSWLEDLLEDHEYSPFVAPAPNSIPTENCQAHDSTRNPRRAISMTPAEQLSAGCIILALGIVVFLSYSEPL